MKVNRDYLNIFKEPALFGALAARHTFKRKANVASDAILIVNVCLIGEFAASAPAMRELIRQNEDRPIDLLVSPALKSLAQHMIGVRMVYSARSVFARESEGTPDDEFSFHAYEKIIVLRISPDAYRMLDTIETAHIKTGLPHFVTYGAHLGWNLLRGKTPKSWREITFSMVGAPPRDIPFGEIFDFSSAEYKRVRTLPAMHTTQKKIIIHTGASWSTNRWDTNKWIELIKKLYTLDNFRLTFVGAKKDAEEYQFISSRLPFKTHSLIGTIDIVDLTLVLHASDCFIGVDSGPRNLAHLVDLPSVTLLGPGPHMFTPHNPRDIVLDRCGGRGLYQRFFHKEKNRFIDCISPQDVYEAFTVLLPTPRERSG
ncbi:MAG: glycosyltransferase family 9 protein [Minisyncoccia bacterium]|jgi:ADP-heptose:LPS heptosyltransferase